MNSEQPDNQMTASDPSALAGDALPVKIGFLSPWNQECGLATYGRFLVEQFLTREFVVLAERDVAITRPDEPFVKRCWTRATPGQTPDDYTQLRDVILHEGVGLLHLNCQARFFAQPRFAEFIREIRTRGVKVVVQIHNLFTASDDLHLLLSNADAVLVHTPENRLEAIANGCPPSQAHVVNHGVVIRSPEKQETKRALRAKLKLEQDVPLIMAFGFIQPHKGMEGVLEAVLHLKQKGIRAQGVIVGAPRSDDQHSVAYAHALEDLARSHNINDSIHFVKAFVTDKQVGEYLSAADLVVMNYRSQHFEASGACSLALGCGAVVMTSLAPAMMGFGDSVWHLTAGYGAGLTAELMLGNPDLYEEIKRNARTYCERNSWPRTAEKVIAIYRSLGLSPAQRELEDAGYTKEKIVTTTTNTPPRKKRVLMQNRPGTFEQRGGDTVVLEKLRDGLMSRGWDVVVDVGATQDPQKFDLVHLFNFATTSYTQELAQRAHRAGVPYVVTTLYEDLPEFHNQSHLVASRLVEYVARGQDKAWWVNQSTELHTAHKAGRFPCDWIASHAAALFPNGAGEARALRRDYPTTKAVVEVPLGHEVGALCGPEMFERSYGVKDFVLCVGRIESRKNQLMLLKALEESELTVVLAAGGFSYQPEYERAVRSFKRRGKTLILDRLTPEMLSSAYAAARVHVLPSWYELPGLVSLEAAAHGKNIVVTRTGTTADYVGDKAFYCLPGSEDSIASAVMAAYYAPAKVGLVDMARGYTWEKAVECTVEAYERILGLSSETSSSKGIGVYDMSMNPAEFQDSLDAGELAAKRMDFEVALEHLTKAEKMDPRSVRVLKGIGAVYLAQGKVDDAQRMFERALSVDPSDPKALTGRGMCEMTNRRHSEAAPYFQAALKVAPDHLVALHQFMECAYSLGSLGDLAHVLERYLALKADDTAIRYCYAGCLFKQGRLAQSREQVEKVIEVAPQHGAALELQKLLLDRAPEVDMVVAMSEQPRGVLGTDRNAQESTVQENTPVQSKLTIPEASMNPLHASLTDLSKRITEWKVNAENTQRQTLVRQNEEITLPQVPRATEIGESVAMAAPSQEGSDYLEALLEKVEDLKREKLFEEAKSELDKVVMSAGMSSKQRHRARCLEAEFLVLEGNLAGAAEIYETILGENPACVRALCGKGAITADAQRWPEAKALFEEALRAEPGYDVALAGLGLCAMVGNKEEDAFNLFVQAAKKNPENHRAIFGVLQLGFPLQRFSQMEELLNAYLDLHPASIDMLYSLAGVLFKQGKMSQARLEVEKILLFEPENERALELQKIIQDKQSASTTMM